MRYVLSILCLCSTLAFGQKTLKLNDNQTSPKANLEQVSWITGHWQGEAFGGIAEEIWSPPIGESMMFVFRLINEGKVSFYEIGHIRENEGSLILQLKHFDGNLKGWEEKEETIDFKLVKILENAVYFEGMTIERISENQIKFYVLVENEDDVSEMVFDYTRKKY